MALTLGQLLEIASGWESRAASCYREMSSLFSAHPAIATFWNDMADEEDAHLTLLAQAGADICEETLAEPVDPALEQTVRDTDRMLDAECPDSVANLDDAYELAHLFESSEVNVIVRLLLARAVGGDHHQQWLTSQFEEHVEDLMAFGRSHPRELRRAIAAGDGAGPPDSDGS